MGNHLSSHKGAHMLTASMPPAIAFIRLLVPPNPVQLYGVSQLHGLLSEGKRKLDRIKTFLKGLLYDPCVVNLHKAVGSNVSAAETDCLYVLMIMTERIDVLAFRVDGANPHRRDSTA